jgi:hypothetical protein
MPRTGYRGRWAVMKCAPHSAVDAFQGWSASEEEARDRVRVLNRAALHDAGVSPDALLAVLGVPLYYCVQYECGKAYRKET